MKLRSGVVVVAAGVSLFASVASAAAPPSDDAIFAYLQAFDSTSIDLATPLAAPGSAAEQYLAFQTGLARANEVAGNDPVPHVVTPGGQGQAEACQDDGQGGGFCSTFADFQTDGGLISTFAVDGNDIGPRLSGRGDPVTAGPLTITAFVAYHTVSGDDFVVLADLAATETVDVSAYSAVYVGPDGRQLDPVDVQAPSTLYAGATAIAQWTFPSSDPGGTMHMPVYAGASGGMLDAAISIPLLVPVPSGPTATTTT